LPRRNLRERGGVLDREQFADLTRRRRLKMPLGDLGGDAMAFRALGESGRGKTKDDEQLGKQSAYLDGELCAVRADGAKDLSMGALHQRAR
jgi:hypothetical protein